MTNSSVSTPTATMAATCQTSRDSGRSSKLGSAGPERRIGSTPRNSTEAIRLLERSALPLKASLAASSAVS